MTRTNHTWPEMVTTALLGTQHAALPTPKGHTAVDQLIAQMPQQDAAAALLAAAGTVALHQQTGWVPSQASPPTPVSQPPDQPVLPAGISRQLEPLLDTSHTSLLPEMLDALAQTGYRVPEFLLPNLLEKGVKAATIRPSLLQILGERGRWLASQNPAWRYAAPELDTWVGLLAEWKTAVAGQRLALLRQLRQTEPERGRTLLEHTWKSETDQSRHHLIKILEVNLSQADEPFLEAALDDRTHYVRQTAADVLACLPTSRLSRRMTEHAANLLRWTPGGKYVITVTFPDVYTPAMKRDGLFTASDGDLSKTRARQLTQIVGRMPLDFWTEQWQQTPQTIAEAVLQSAWPRTLTNGFATAAARQKDVIWAEALITANGFGTAVARLVSILPTETCFRLMQQAAQKSTGLQRTDPLFIVLQHWQLPWTAPMGQFWLERFADHLNQHKDDKPEPTLKTLLTRFAQRCDPTLADTAVTQLTIPDLNPAWQKIVNLLCETILLRRNLLAEIHRLNVDH
ncbi:MAG: hypothetical protein H6657_22780 [Ardenticatenaceae bacterium]|nr:hypothetical protein [Ardenticatenaceae bacterium]